MKFFSVLSIAVLSVLAMSSASHAYTTIDFSHAMIDSPFAHVIYENTPEGEALSLLAARIKSRSGISMPAVVNKQDFGGPLIILTTSDKTAQFDEFMPYPDLQTNTEAWHQPDGYRISVRTVRGKPPVVWAVGYDARGALFAAGRLLREFHYGPGKLALSRDLEIATAPAYPLRGHQLGYRAKSNSYDAWTPSDYEEYIRDLILFGTNAIEQIPLQEAENSPHFPIPRREMNIALSKICQRYGLEYWMWMPVMDHTEEDRGVAALSAKEERQAILKQWKQLFQDCTRIDAVYVPTGDPGINKGSLLMPFLEQAAKVLRAEHPDAKIWISQQSLLKEDIDFVFDYLEEHKPDWFGGIGYGPWTKITLDETRTRLPKQYKIRLYPDITHTMMCGTPVYGFDRALALTAGREPINPRPRAQALLHNTFAPDTCGFITYSDGHHDDANKFIWSAVGWNPQQDVRDICAEYVNAFMDTEMSEEIADAILALETNWEGPLASNGSVEATLKMWQSLEARAPELGAKNWRFQQGLFRAYFDAYTRHRLIHETELQQRVDSILIEPGHGWDSIETMYRAGRFFRLADLEPVKPEWRKHIVEIADRMFEISGHQTSVDRYQQLDYDRGTMLDTLDHPLNDRWWYEDRFEAIRAVNTDEERLQMLRSLALYESPKPGTIYDDIGNIDRQPDLVQSDGWSLEPMVRWTQNEKALSWEPYMDRRRHSQMDGIGNFDFYSPAWSFHMRYVSLNREAEYTYRVGIQIDPKASYHILIDGDDVTGTIETKDNDYIEVPIPTRLSADGVLDIEWTIDEGTGIFVTEAFLIPNL